MPRPGIPISRVLDGSAATNVPKLEPMATPWIPRLDPNIFPPYIAVVRAVQRAIADGTLAPGDRLPPQRFLADFLGLSVNTVGRGLREAARLGVTSAKTRGGTVIRADAVTVATASVGLRAERK